MANVIKLDGPFESADPVSRSLFRLREKIDAMFQHDIDGGNCADGVDDVYKALDRHERLLNNRIQERRDNEERSKPLPRRLLALKTFQLRGTINEIHGLVDLNRTDDHVYELAKQTEKMMDEIYGLERVVHKLQDGT